MSKYFYDNFEDDDNDYIERNIKVWTKTDLEKYFMITGQDLSEKERIEIDFYFIDKYYPGSSKLSDDELVREKYYESKHCFQYVVSIKRMVETSGQGSVFADQAGCRYGFGER